MIADVGATTTQRVLERFSFQRSFGPCLCCPQSHPSGMRHVLGRSAFRCYGVLRSHEAALHISNVVWRIPAANWMNLACADGASQRPKRLFQR